VRGALGQPAQDDLRKLSICCVLTMRRLMIQLTVASAVASGAASSSSEQAIAA
jgi:hypothetical protein